MNKHIIIPPGWYKTRKGEWLYIANIGEAM